LYANAVVYCYPGINVKIFRKKKKEKNLEKLL